MAALFAAGCGENPASQRAKSSDKWNRDSAEAEFRLLQAELKLAETGKPYLILNLHENALTLKLKGAVVWSHRIDVAPSDAGDVRDFVDRFRGAQHRVVRPLEENYLYAASDQTPDSILKIVSEATKFPPELLQRAIPERFYLLWQGGLTLEVKTDVAGEPRSGFKNTMFRVRQALRKPFGDSHVIVRMKPDEAITLYRVAQPGLPTLLYPPAGS
jgi:hypothetical protein